MLIAERQQRLIEILREQKSVQLEALAERLGVSVSTARRDLEALEHRGLVERTHGGAIFRGEQRHPAAMSERMRENVEAKRAIGAAAAKLVEPNMTLLLDGGSTVYYAAELVTARPLQVVTSSLQIASLFADDEQVELVVLGGILYPRSATLVGPIATRCLADLHADLLLFSLAGIYEHDAYNINLDMAEVERVMLQQAARSVMLMDASKFGRKSLARVCRVEDVERIIADPDVSDHWQRQLADRLVIAGD